MSGCPWWSWRIERLIEVCWLRVSLECSNSQSWLYNGTQLEKTWMLQKYPFYCCRIWPGYRDFENLPRWYYCAAKAEQYHQRTASCSAWTSSSDFSFRWMRLFGEDSNILSHAYVHFILFLIWPLHSQLWKASLSPDTSYFTFWGWTWGPLWMGNFPAQKHGEGFYRSNGILNSFQQILF